MLTLRIDFKNFHARIKSKKNLKKKLKSLIKENSEILKSLSLNYKNNFNKKKLVKYKKFSNFRVIGMGGSILGTQAIYDFLNDKINKKFSFVNNLHPQNKKNKEKKNYKSDCFKVRRNHRDNCKFEYSYKKKR